MISPIFSCIVMSIPFVARKAGGLNGFCEQSHKILFEKGSLFQTFLHSLYSPVCLYGSTEGEKSQLSIPCRVIKGALMRNAKINANPITESVVLLPSLWYCIYASS